jgi:hypothetical protein
MKDPFIIKAIQAFLVIFLGFFVLVLLSLLINITPHLVTGICVIFAVLLILNAKLRKKVSEKIIKFID